MATFKVTDAAPAPTETAKPADNVTDVLSQYNEGRGGIDTVTDVANAIDALPDAPQSARDAVARYRASLAEDQNQLGKRGDVDAYEKELMDALSRPPPAAQTPAAPPAEVPKPPSPVEAKATAGEPAKPTTKVSLEEMRQLLRDMMETRRLQGQPQVTAHRTRLAEIESQLKGETPEPGAIASELVFGHPEATNIGGGKYSNLVPIKVTGRDQVERFRVRAQAVLDEIQKKISTAEVVARGGMKGDKKAAQAYLKSANHTEDSTIRDMLRQETLAELDRLYKALPESTTPATVLPSEPSAPKPVASMSRTELRAEAKRLGVKSPNAGNDKLRAQIEETLAKRAAMPPEPVSQTTKRQRGGMSQKAREDNPVAALVEDNGGIRPYTRRETESGTKERPYLREHYTGVPLRFRARKGGGLAPDQMLGIVQEQFPAIDSVEKMNEAMSGTRKRLSQDQYEQELAERAMETDATATPIRAEDVSVGDTFEIRGEKFRVLEETDTALRVKDGVEHWLPFDGSDYLSIDKGTLVKAGKPAPTARPTQGATDLLQRAGVEEEFSLVGERATDGERIAAEKAKAERDAAEAKRIADERQGDMFAQKPAAAQPSVVEGVVVPPGFDPVRSVEVCSNRDCPVRRLEDELRTRNHVLDLRDPRRRQRLVGERLRTGEIDGPRCRTDQTPF
jgi:hypothetical protein